MPSIDAITDIAIVASDRPEDVPSGYYCISETVEGNYGGVNAGGYFNFNKRSGPFIAFKRLRSDEAAARPPITQIAIRDVDDYLRSNPHLQAAEQRLNDEGNRGTAPSTSIIGNFRKRLSGKPNRSDLNAAQNESASDRPTESTAIPPPKSSKNGTRWELVTGNLNRGSLGHSLQIWVQRDIESDPVIDLVVINQSKSEQIPFGFEQTQNVDDRDRAISLNEGAGHRDRLCLCLKTRKLGHFQAKRSQWFQPQIIDRYPLDDHAEFALTGNVAPFCFPRGMDIVGGRRRQKSTKRTRRRTEKRRSVHCRSSALGMGTQIDLDSILMDNDGADHSEPADPSLDDMHQNDVDSDTESESISDSKDDEEAHSLIANDDKVRAERLRKIHGSEQHTFVLSTEFGAKIYGVCIVFYEEQSVDHRQQRRLQKDKATDSKRLFREWETVHVPKAICVLSHYPFYDGFLVFLQDIYCISMSPANRVPLEKYVAHFFHSVPLPLRGHPGVEYSIGTKVMSHNFLYEKMCLDACFVTV